MAQKITISGDEIRALYDLAVTEYQNYCDRKGYRYIEPSPHYSTVNKTQVVLMYPGGHLAVYDIQSREITE